MFFKHDKSDFYENKIAELATKLGAADDKRIKSMHQRNIDILNNFKDFHMVWYQARKNIKIWDYSFYAA